MHYHHKKRRDQRLREPWAKSSESQSQWLVDFPWSAEEVGPKQHLCQKKPHNGEFPHDLSQPQSVL
jgi:hypothetical protein